MHHAHEFHRGESASPCAADDSPLSTPRVPRRWLTLGTLVSGLLALVWLVWRSGAKPARLVYPCQQAAFGAAAGAFGVPLVTGLAAVRRKARGFVGTSLVVVAATGGLLAAATWGYLANSNGSTPRALTPPPDYRATVFHVTDCPPDPIGERFVGVDNLISLMGREGLKFHRSPTVSLVAGPDGTIGVDDVVIVKINYQWDERGGTNTDVLRGVIRRVLDHPDGFTGEVVVCENAQFNSVSNFDRAANNAQDITLSPHDVVSAFAAAGEPVSHYDWTACRGITVGEYDTGDVNDGYVVGPYDPAFAGRVAYPKFRTSEGTYISLRYGIWDPTSGIYDRSSLRFINLPVLKSHSAAYGATACVKHYMGVVTTSLNTQAHYATRYGLLGVLIADIQPADLNILDCIWINANPYDGPWTTYAAATRRNTLVASTDPVAADIWAVKHVLIPAFLSNGYTPPWPQPSADPDDPGSDFREYLDNSMSYLLAAGVEVTNDIDQIDAQTWNGAGDADGDSDVDVADLAAFVDCHSGPGLLPPNPCSAFDLNTDGDVDLADFAQFQRVFTGELHW